MSKKSLSQIIPNSGNIIIQWLKANPETGNGIAISNQPHAQYQDSILKTIIHDNFLHQKNLRLVEK